jgi:UrcA family protein
VLGGSIICVANAAPPSDLPTAIVKFEDLDMVGQAGKQELDHRLSRAARTVCHALDPSESASKLQVTSLYKACIEQAVSGATAQINRADFTDYVAAKMSKPASSGVWLASR